MTADSMNIEFEKQKVINSMQIEMARIQEAKIATQKEIIVVNRQSSSSATTTISSTTTKKKGWSSTAKGAVIRAGVGAARGAIISKKKVLEPIIVGVAGTGIAAIIDGSKKE